MTPPRPTLTVVGRRLAAEDHRLRDMLTRVAQPFDWVEAGTPEASDALRASGADALELPVVIDREEVVGGATVERLVEQWHLTDPPSKTDYDLAIVGAGPAGLAAAVYAASDGLSTVVIEENWPGGQASHTSLIENFFGFPDGIGGAELARMAGRQAERFGAELVLLRGVTGSRAAAGRLRDRRCRRLRRPRAGRGRRPRDGLAAAATSRASTSCSAAACTTAPGAARPPSAAATTSSWSAQATPPARR